MSRTSPWFAAATTLAGALLLARLAAAQCMPANPSFEVLSGNGFGGWTTFGTVAISTTAAHGLYSARVTGPNSGQWAVNGLWQSLTCTPGQQWAVSVCVQSLSAAPLAGGSQAILNVEWHDGSGNLISFESHAVATPATAPDQWTIWSGQTGAAPAGTASIHLLLGVLQGPTDPTPQVLFDEVTCVPVTNPSLDSLQWSDFPSGRTVAFAGRTWRVKGPGYLGPGPNLFDNSSSAVWVDGNGQLDLTIHKIGGSWYSSEVALVDSLGYGDYVFTTRGRLDTLDPNAVFGMFLWEYGPCYDTSYLWWNPFNEIDVEISRWGYATNPDAQFVAQPGSTGGNTHRFGITYADTDLVSYAMRWLPHDVEYRCWRGGPDAEATSPQLAAWTYTGQNEPRPESPRVHLNLWQLAAPTTTQTVVLNAFEFHPACPSGNCGVLGVAPPQPDAARLAPAAPNPFAGRTLLRYVVATPGAVELAVFDLAGRQVRRLAAGPQAAGPHAVEWDGLDDAGRRVGAGVYFYRLLADGRAQAQRVVVLR